MIRWVCDFLGLRRKKDASIRPYPPEPPVTFEPRFRVFPHDSGRAWEVQRVGGHSGWYAVEAFETRERAAEEMERISDEAHQKYLAHVDRVWRMYDAQWEHFVEQCESAGVGVIGEKATRHDQA